MGFPSILILSLVVENNVCVVFFFPCFLCFVLFLFLFFFFLYTIIAFRSSNVLLFCCVQMPMDSQLNMCDACMLFLLTVGAEKS